jgi:hypothetical protein
LFLIAKENIYGKIIDRKMASGKERVEGMHFASVAVTMTKAPLIQL